MSVQEQVAQWKAAHPDRKPEPPLSAQDIEEFRKEAALRKAGVISGDEVSLKVSKKGCISVYGLRRFPVSLYPSEWEKLLANAERIKRFIAAHGEELAVEGVRDIPQNEPTRSYR